jgi:hypothetical protein
VSSTPPTCWVKGVLGFGWSSWDCDFLWAPEAAGQQDSAVNGRNQDGIPYPHPSHGSRPPGFLLAA